MTNPEFIQSATNAIHQVRELIDAGAKANLLQTLTDLGHPYGLLVNSTSIPHKKEVKGKEDVNFWKTTSLFPSSLTYPIVSSVRAIRHNLREKRGDRRLLDDNYHGEGFSRSIGPLSSVNNLNQAEDIGIALLAGLIFKSLLKFSVDNNVRFDKLFTAQTVLAPGILKSLTEIGDRPRDLRVSRNHISLGSSSIHLGTYKGETLYMIKFPDGSPLAQINPGDTLGSVHVSSQANFLRNLSPLEKVDQITQDFVDLLKVIGAEVNPNLSGQQQETIGRAKQATIIGISHLVRLFRHRTGLPTWKLDVLPDLVQRFHQHDSQAVSRAFGGTRKVKTSDVEMMVVTPQMRQQLVAQSL